MRRTSHINFAFLVMLLLAIFVRSLIPVGFMPSHNAGSAITICSGLTTKTIILHNKSGHEQKSEHSEPCSFAPPVLAGTTPVFAATDFISIAYAPFHPDNQVSALGAHLVFKSFFSQGPPENIVI